MMKADHPLTALPCDRFGVAGKAHKTDHSIEHGYEYSSDKHSTDKHSNDLDRFKRQMLTDEPAAIVAGNQTHQGSPGDAILKNLYSRQRLAPSAQPLDTAKLNSLIQRIVDRILVGVVSADGHSEVRIHFNSEQLGNTEIRLQRNQGQLQVQMITSSVDIERTALGLKGGLQQTLQEKLMTLAVNVEVLCQDSGGEQQDGRSRNPYILIDAADKQKEEQ